MDHARAEHVRKMITGACMIAAPLLFLASDSLWPVTHADPADMVADAVGNRGRTYASDVLAVLAFVALTGAILGLAHLLHERRPGLAVVGGALALTGIVINATVTGAVGLFLAEAPQGGRDVAVTSKLLDDMFTSALPMFVFGLLLTVGSLIFAYGLWRAEVMPAWTMACLALSSIGIPIGNMAVLKPVIFAGEVLMLIGLGAVGWQIIAEPDAEWEHTPEFHGFARAVTA